MSAVADRTPAQAWANLRAGNDRFARGQAEHPRRGLRRRAELVAEQHPSAVVLGCSDSRVPPEVVLDQGLGDLFVVRTAGHVLDPAVLGSVEFGVAVLGAPLVVVLGHEGCGAVAAAVAARATGELPPGSIRAVVERILPSAPTPGGGTGVPDATELGRRHVRRTVRTLAQTPALLAAAVAAARCAVLGLEYGLTDGRVRLIETVGRVD